MVWQCSTEDHMSCFKDFFLMIRHTTGEVCASLRQKIIRLSSFDLCSWSLRWFIASGFVIVGPVSATLKKLKLTSLKNEVRPIRYFPIGISVLVAFNQHKHNKRTDAYYCILSNSWSVCFEKLLSQVATLTAIVSKIRSIITVFGTEFPSLYFWINCKSSRGAYFFIVNCTSATSCNCDEIIMFFLIATAMNNKRRNNH